MREKLELFIRELAKFLVDEQSRKEVELSEGKRYARDWAALRALTPIRGYPTVDEAERALREFIGLEDRNEEHKK
jgi:hypothetical protein